jgi:hypothetical protein
MENAMILASCYTFENVNHLSVQVGLDCSRNYNPIVKINNNGKSLILEASDFIHICDKIWGVAHHEEDSRLLDHEIIYCKEKQSIQFIERSLRTLFSTMQDLDGSFSPLEDTFFEISLNDWNLIREMDMMLKYKISALFHYKIYTRLTHSKIVNYFLRKFGYDASNFFNDVLSFKNALLLLDSTALPYDCPLKYDKAQFDFRVCQLIDSEIRMYSAEIIFSQLINLFSIYSVDKLNLLGWWMS